MAKIVKLVLTCWICILLPVFGVDAQTGVWHWSQLIRNPELQDELSTIGPQIEEMRRMYDSEETKFRQIRKEMQDNVDRLYQSEYMKIVLLRESTSNHHLPFEPSEVLVAATNEIEVKRVEFESELREKMEDVLLPHQIKRLQQLVVWSHVNCSEGYATGIITDPLKSALELDAAQVQRVLEDARLLQSEFEEELFLLRKKYRERLEQELTERQRNQLRSLLGEDSRFLSTRLGF